MPSPVLDPRVGRTQMEASFLAGHLGVRADVHSFHFIMDTA